MINIIETERLFLRPLTLEDADVAYYGWTKDAKVAEYVSCIERNRGAFRFWWVNLGRTMATISSRI